MGAMRCPVMGFFTLDLKPTQEMYKSTYHGPLVVGDIDGRWKLASVAADGVGWLPPR